MERKAKQELVHELHKIFQQAGLIVLMRPIGMSVSQSNELRVKSGESECAYKVTKNTLTKIALKDTPYVHLEDEFKGPTSILWSTDIIAAAKVAADFAKKFDEISIISGAMGTKFLNATDVETLSKLPSLDGLRSKLIGVLQAPAVKIAGVIQAPPAQLARVINAYGQKDSAA